MFLLPELTKCPTPIPRPSPSPPTAITSRSGLHSLAPWANGSTLPCNVCIPYVWIKWGVFPEHPIPEKIAALCVGTASSANAICMAFNIPKSPQPGHQSLCTSVL